MADRPGEADWRTVRVEVRCVCRNYLVLFSDGHYTRCNCGRLWELRSQELPSGSGARMWVSVQQSKRQVDVA